MQQQGTWSNYICSRPGDHGKQNEYISAGLQLVAFSQTAFIKEEEENKQSGRQTDTCTSRRLKAKQENFLKTKQL